MMKMACPIVLALSVSAAAAQQTAADRLQELRDYMIATEGIRAIAAYALKDYAEAKGKMDRCGLSPSAPDFEALATKYGEWLKPGIWNWISGERGKAIDKALRDMEFSYSLAQIQPDCSPLMQSTLKLTFSAYLHTFNEALRQSPD